MLKLLLTTLLLGAGAPNVSAKVSCFSTGTACISTGDSRLSTSSFSQNITFSQKDSWAYISKGNKALLSGYHRLALKYFDEAFQHVDTSLSSSLPVDFLITLGQVIAYDYQRDQALCRQALGSFVLATQNWENHLENNSDSSSYSSSSSDSSGTSYSTDSNLSEIQDFLSSLISIAPSSDIKELLTDITSFFIEDLHPYFNYDKQSF